MVSLSGRIGLLAGRIGVAILLCLLVSVPAYGQETGGGVQYSDSFNETSFCNQVQAIIADIDQVQGGDAVAVADQYSEAAAEISQDLGVSQDAVLNCIIGTGAEGTNGGEDTDETTGDDGDTTGEDTKGDVTDRADVVAGTTVKGTLPDTSGSSLAIPMIGAELLCFGLALLRRR